MSDEVFQGPDFSEDRKSLAEELDLFSLSNQTKALWKLPEYSPLHRAILILISKGLTHEFYSKILERLEKAIGKREITPKNFTMKDATLKAWGLSAEKIAGIRKLLKLPEVDTKALCKIKEGGIYCVKAFKILTEEDDDVFLWEDYNVLRCLGILFFKDKPMSKAEAMQVSRNWAGYRSQISYFLHRLRPEGACKIIDEKELDEYDFWGANRPSSPDVDGKS